MKNKIFKILGAAVTVAMVLTLAAAFSAPAAASPDETLNEWYPFDYPVPGADGDWFYDPTIGSVGPIAEAINGDLYTAVSFGEDATFTVSTTPPAPPSTLSIMHIPGSAPNTGYITAMIAGDYSSPGELRSGYFSARWCFHSPSIEGSVYACGFIAEADPYDVLMFSGYIVGNFPEDTYDITDGGFDLTANGKLEGQFDFEGEQALWTYFCGSYELGSSLMKSTNGGRTWEKTGYEDVEVDIDPTNSYIVPPGPVVDMVCSSIDEDVIYVTDGRYVYKSDDGGDTFDFVAKDSLETVLVGNCGCPIWTCVISSIDVTYDADDNPFVFIGTREHWGDLPPAEASCYYGDWMPGDVYYIGEAGYPANWTSLNLACFHGGGFEALAVGCAPNWADTKETYVVVSGTGFNTYVVYTKGTVCGWYELAELKYDCKYPFGSFAASRIGFPDDWADSETLFVGIVDEYPCVADDTLYPDIDAQGGDVYMATDGDAIDLNVAGLVTGCEGKESVDIISLDVMGDADEAQLIAGAFCSTDVYYSTDGGWSWDVSEKNPTGSWATYVLWYEDTAVAGTTCCNAAFSMSCGEEVGQYWNQISLISTSIDCVNYIDHSPGYLADSETLFMITKDCESCYVCDCEVGMSYPTDTLSLFRYDGTYWERVFLNITAEVATEWQVHVSPDFNDTNCVYVGNEYFEMWRSTDAGCSWDKLTFPCETRPCISAWEVIDEDTVIAGGACHSAVPCEDACGYVYKTTRHGARPWDKYELPDTAGCAVSFALEPGYEDPGSILLGDNNGQVFISEDGGETWDLVGEAIVGSVMYYPVWVTFDPGYATNHIIYAATGKVIARCIIDPDLDWADQTWEEICSGLNVADGIQVAGDTALYVTDNYRATAFGDCGVFRSLNPDAEDADDVVFEELWEGLDPGTQLRNLWLTTDVSDEGCTENVLWSLEWDDQACDYCERAGPDIWVYEDTLAQPVVLNMPVDEQKLAKTTEATLSWKELCGADCYEVSLYAYCAECPDQKLAKDLCLECSPVDDVVCGTKVTCNYDCCPCTSDTCIVVKDLDPGTTYYWQVRVCQGKPRLSKWSELRSFTTALLPVPFVDLCSPACGSQDIILTPNFAWGAVEGATGYEVQIAPTETFTAGVIKGKTEVNAWVCPETLEYATTYYWRVRAEKDSIYSDWTYCMFTTMPEPVAPTPPVTVEQVPPSPAPVINIPPAKMITPTWIYAIIGVGAALAIVVIVLIVRTRRPPA
jgi:photosystem II stability/assembly factor-like uncharacterized protein